MSADHEMTTHTNRPLDEVIADSNRMTYGDWANRLVAVFEKAHTPTPKDREDLDALRRDSAEMPPSQIACEAIVNHRIGFWNINESYPADITTAHIELADEELERYVQQRIAAHPHTPTDDKREALYHDEDTLRKVFDALEGVTGSEVAADDCLHALQNAGILFRERRTVQVDAGEPRAAGEQ